MEPKKHRLTALEIAKINAKVKFLRGVGSYF